MQSEAILAEVPEHDLGALDNFPHLKIVPVEVAGRRIGVVRRDENIFAFADICPHHGAPMCNGKLSGTMFPSEPDEYHYGLEGLVIKCPWHAYEFSLQTGESMGGVIRSRLIVFQTAIRDRNVYVRLKRIPAN